MVVVEVNMTSSLATGVKDGDGGVLVRLTSNLTFFRVDYGRSV